MGSIWGKSQSDDDMPKQQQQTTQPASTTGTQSAAAATETTAQGMYSLTLGFARLWKYIVLHWMHIAAAFFAVAFLITVILASTFAAANTNLQSEVATLQKHNKEQKDDIASLHKDINSLSQQYDELQEKETQYEQERQSLDQRKQDLDKRENDLNTRSSQLDERERNIAYREQQKQQRIEQERQAQLVAQQQQESYSQSQSVASNDSGGSAYYKNCAAVRRAGKAPLYAGQPGYSGKLDADGDGIACEWH